MKDKREEIVGLNKTLFGMSDEMLDMKKRKKNAKKEKQKAVLVLKRKLTSFNKVLRTNDELRNVIEDESDMHDQDGNNNNPKVGNNSHLKVVGKIKEGGGHGGNCTWPLWMVQLILESLVNGTPPSAIPSNITSHISIINPEIEIKEVPSVRYVRKCRTILRIVGETLASYRLAKAKDWDQMFTDGTGRRQTAIQNLIFRIKEDNILRNIILSSAIILKGECSVE